METTAAIAVGTATIVALIGGMLYSNEHYRDWGIWVI